MFGIAWDFSAFDNADYVDDSTGVNNLPSDQVTNIKHEDPEVEAAFDSASDQRTVLDLTKAASTYTDIDFVAAVNVNMDASGASKVISPL